ncbi:dienelactone hydrolase family protein [Asticcacaulis sp. YBE204]|uniref:dienelactone hydrolase family protein n=1 Tax=Asticcacaulis sp. YBE204 TaxID=1282363 RepID=UPI0003C3B880|nr:dienelactone hydrolase family protein [Asticcacaulis sp. YBE204]ESQ78962.1 hypothetical protein AEYBE204_11100 [Asticcacaulis sp. YBE204]
MCDDDIHQGLVHDPRLSRRGFALAAAGGLTLASSQTFAAAAVTASAVTVKTPDGEADAVLFHPASKGKWPAVLIWTDVMGLRPVFEDMGRRLAAEGYVVLVPNPYYRVRKSPVVEGTFNFAVPADREKLTPLRASITPEGTLRDATAFVAFLDAQAVTDTKRKVGVQGYCMGGPLAFRTAVAASERIGAVATFHGGGLATDQPSSPHLLIPQTKAEYLIEIAANDDAKDPGAKDRLKAAFEAAKRPAIVEVFEGADHGWTVRTSQVYNEAAAEKAWANLLALYKRAL